MLAHKETRHAKYWALAFEQFSVGKNILDGMISAEALTQALLTL
jgi:hypothetical protein